MRGSTTGSVVAVVLNLFGSEDEGYVLVRNPLFPQKASRYELDPAVVDCVEFYAK